MRRLRHVAFHGGRARRAAACAVWLFALLPAACGIAVSGSGNETSIPAARSAVATSRPLAQELIDAAEAEGRLLADLFARAAPSVVNLTVTRRVPGGASQIVHGSGFVFDEQGHIVTNAHVINSSNDILVVFEDHTVADAEIRGIDVFSDLAVLRVPVGPERLHPVTFGDSDALHIGDRAIALGNPFGLGSSMSVGTIGGLGRQLPSAELVDSNVGGGFQNPSIIQVDADINPGNSGGPLLNTRGEVIGVSTDIRTVNDALGRAGFAIPARTVRRVIPELIAGGQVNYPWLGITSIAPDNGFNVPALADALDLPVTNGILVSSVAPGSPAEKSGLRGGGTPVMIREREICSGGDIIVSVDGRFVAGMDDLLSYLVDNAAPGDTVNLVIVRGDETLELPVLLEARPTSGIAPPARCG